MPSLNKKLLDYLFKGLQNQLAQESRKLNPKALQSAELTRSAKLLPVPAMELPTTIPSLHTELGRRVPRNKVSSAHTNLPSPVSPCISNKAGEKVCSPHQVR